MEDNKKDKKNQEDGKLDGKDKKSVEPKEEELVFLSQ
jgi:hypothetical protein